MDTVYSGKGASPKCLLTLTERKLRVEIVRKIPNRTATSVTAEIDKLERQIGASLFKKLFLSITPDNGSEFSDAMGLERSAVSDSQRTQLYFAHPYSSFERVSQQGCQIKVFRRDSLL